MSLRARLMMLGAVLPAFGLLAAFAFGGWQLARQLIERVDAGLQAQAAVELVSLVDDEAPHLHAGSTPQSDFRAWAEATAAYRADGTRMLSSQPWMPERWSADGWGEGPLRRTVDGFRELAIRVEAGAARVLVLRTPLGEYRATIAIYWVITGLATAGALALLIGLQARLSGEVERRLEGLSTHMTRLGRGDFAARPPPARRADVIGRLRDQIAAASVELETLHRTRERFLAHAAHELRTPLAAMSARIDVALRRKRSDGDLEAVCEAMRGEIARLAGLSTRLLDLARRTDGGHAPIDCDLGDVLRAAADAARDFAEARAVAIVLTVPDEAPACVDPDAIRQALDNLIDNGLRHAPEGSLLEVRVWGERGAWWIEVQDEGPGIPEAEREAVFEPFVTGRSEGGAGLGLAIVRAIAEAHGGEVEVGAGPGGVLRLRIPRQA